MASLSTDSSIDFREATTRSANLRSRPKPRRQSPGGQVSPDTGFFPNELSTERRHGSPIPQERLSRSTGAISKWQKIAGSSAENNDGLRNGEFARGTVENRKITSEGLFGSGYWNYMDNLQSLASSILGSD